MSLGITKSGAISHFSPSVRDRHVEVRCRSHPARRPRQYEQLRAGLGDHPRITVEIIQGLGHSHPSDLDQKVEPFLNRLWLAPTGDLRGLDVHVVEPVHHGVMWVPDTTIVYQEVAAGRVWLCSRRVIAGLAATDDRAWVRERSWLRKSADGRVVAALIA